MLVIKAGRVGSCNFRTDMTNFWHNSDSWLQISIRGDYGCSEFEYCP